MSDTQTFAERLKALRKKVGLTQEELAHLVNVSLKTFHRWEKSERQPRLEEIKRLAEALHVSEDELLNGTQSTSDWVLQIKISQTFKEEIIDMRKGAPNISSITATPDGAFIALGGVYDNWQDDKKFNKIIADLKRLRAAVIQNGKALGGIKE